MGSTAQDVTRWLRAHERGEDGALERAVELIYRDLKYLAGRQLRKSGRPLDTTALVHEAYIRLVDRDEVGWNDRGHFLAAAATAMRHVLVDRIRRRAASKRGGGQAELPLDEAGEIPGTPESKLALAVHDALERLQQIDERLVRIVECRFYAGFTAEETSTALGISSRTVERDWRRARAWLRQALTPDGQSSADDPTSPLP
jgi:RNA polymerase sigma factor (TIGR02999 family)